MVVDFGQVSLEGTVDALCAIDGIECGPVTLPTTRALRSYAQAPFVKYKASRACGPCLEAHRCCETIPKGLCRRCEGYGYDNCPLTNADIRAKSVPTG